MFYTEKTANEILELHAGGESIRDIVKRDDMPCRATIYNWRVKFPEFDALYTKAVECHVDAIVDDIRNTIDNASEQEAKITKVKVDYYLWLAARLNRNKFGDRLQIEQTVKLDIAPALKAAMERMSSVQMPAIEAAAKQIE